MEILFSSLLCLDDIEIGNASWILGEPFICAFPTTFNYADMTLSFRVEPLKRTKSTRFVPFSMILLVCTSFTITITLVIGVYVYSKTF